MDEDVKNKVIAELQELQKAVADPNSFSDPNIGSKTKRLASLEKIISLDEQKSELMNKIEQAKQLIANEPDLSELAQEELNDSQEELARVSEELTDELTPKDPNNDRNAVIEIRAGAGGDEASLFASEMFRLYSRFCDNHKFKIEIASESPSEVGGFKEIIFTVKGEEVYRNLKFEAGVHRVQRIPATETQGRVHTSTITIAVLPEAQEQDVTIAPNDLRIDTYRSSGNGGQSVNTTDSAVRITHLPTNIVVTCQDEKSQLKNKDKAMGILRARLLQKQIEEQQSAESEARLKLIGTGDRSEKIRTYNFPQDRITDHRINFSRSNIQGAMDGNIEDLVAELLKAESQLVQANT